MQGFNFEKNLEHQSQAVDSTVAVFAAIKPVAATGAARLCVNPVFAAVGSKAYLDNIKKIQSDNSIDEKPKSSSNIIDIMMETGTGKTYTYTKTMFEINKRFGIFKFVVVVPTLSIKAGTIDFLKSESSRAHFKDLYEKTIKLHVVESQKAGKNKKSYIPPSVSSFVSGGSFDKNVIQVMVINAGMLNSETLQKVFDKTLLDKYAVPMEAIAATRPFMIIDEPHKFGTNTTTWENLQKLQPQFILRYGATFPDTEISKKNLLTGKNDKIKVKDYHNLVYTLTAVDAFNRNLVKGVTGHITEFADGEKALVKLIDTDGVEARFELVEGKTKTTIAVAKKESLEKVHDAMRDLYIENLNKTTVMLSNGMEMKRGDKINPYSFAQTVQEMMISSAIHQHFILEKEMLTRNVKIKPLTLFFIDNIDEYRSATGSIRTSVETLIAAEVTKLLATEENDFYKNYLEKTLENVSVTHGGYFSKDNSEKDEAIEKEINEILHDKQAMLSLDNPRRFIFSKWTLREGWDNPNVFQICKLRSSGSEISKLQEVGRGLRLPVNEYGNRVKDEQFFLNYFVDFTESDFLDKLKNEINSKSGAIPIDIVSEKLDDNMIKQILAKYDIKNENALLQKLIMDDKVIDFAKMFLPDGFAYIKAHYPLIFEGVNSNKIRKTTDPTKKVTIRTEKYAALKALWEQLNEKVVLEYKFENEAAFKQLFTNYLNLKKDNFTVSGIVQRTAEIGFEDGLAMVKEDESIYNRKVTLISTMQYSEFLATLAQTLHINMKTLHESFKAINISINAHLNGTTIRIIKQGFENYLMENALTNFQIEYQKVSNSIHPTKLTDAKGEVLKETNASEVGVFYADDKVANNYFFEDLYYDSELERTNIKTNIKEVIVFTKIPKNSIKIPVAGGKTYSPDFAYVLNYENGQKILHFIVETKNVNNEEILRDEERYKIKHAERFFGNKIKIEFRTQFSNQKIVDLISEILENKK